MKKESLKEKYSLGTGQLDRLDNLKEQYKQLYESPRNCRPKVIVNVGYENAPTWDQQLSDPLVMLEHQLNLARNHILIEDDFIPAVRVNFGTGIIAAGFGCELVNPTGSLPAVKTHAVRSLEQIQGLQKPTLDQPIYKKIEKWTEIWLDNLPQGVAVQHPDIQGPFNTSHLVRGNDILTDFYDDPDAVCRLMDIVTDHTIEVLEHFNRIDNRQADWFHDWGGAYWKGSGRISNCSVDMISPDFYRNYVLPRDLRFMKSVGGGRMHYCGGSKDVIQHFANNPEIYGLDIDAGLHDVWKIAEICPQPLVLAFQQYGKAFPQTDRLLDGDWPEKRNIIVYTEADSVEQGQDLLARLKKSIPY